MPSLKKVLLAVFSVLIALVAVGAMQPAEFRIERQTVIRATPETVFAHVANFHRWETWSPWAKLDPHARNEFGGPESGVGATFGWSGNSAVGEGRMTVLESEPPSRLRIELAFQRPIAAVNLAEFTFQPEGGDTRVAWSMTGRKNLVSKILGLFLSMDRMVGGQFDQGLAQLKAVSEAETASPPVDAAEATSGG